ncbi:Uncharacterized protein dnm_080530 [Desulfonema magnum]|uniref:Uncharacterized protein n=1 Tax=Desulfonema magnum TaxID=45655 RepID=A0A975GSE6_9BACT|nr:Uncharacterized protein dnm_080530 [Desulfonema magnum]
MTNCHALSESSFRQSLILSNLFFIYIQERFRISSRYGRTGNLMPTRSDRECG